MLNTLSLSLRRFGYLVRLEAREAWGITASVVGISLMITFGVALFAHREDFTLAFDVKEALGLALLAFAAFLPVLADIFAGSEERSARRAMASLPVSSGTIFGGQVFVALGAAAAIYAALCAAWMIATAVLGAPAEARPLGHEWGALGTLAGALAVSGVLMLPLAAVTVTCFVAQVFRHALAATVAGWGTAMGLIALYFDVGVIDLGVRFAQFPPVAASVVAVPWAILTLLIGFHFACRLRGSASRSWIVRGGRIALVLGLSSVAAAGIVELRERQRASYGFYDEGAYISCGMPDVSGDGETVVLKLAKDEVETGWFYDLVANRTYRIAEDNLDTLKDPMLSPFDRGLHRRRTALVRESVEVDGDWHRRVWGEEWTSPFDGPGISVEAIHVIPPRRRLPGIAFYFDADRRLHRVDLRTGKDSSTQYVVDGSAFSAGIDEEGRWLTWSDADGHFYAVELATGKRVDHAPEEPLGRIFAAFLVPSIGGDPVVRCLNEDGPSHGVIRDGEVIALPLARRYTHLVDVDGQHLVGISEENGLYLLGPDCEERTVLREPMPNAVPERP